MNGAVAYSDFRCDGSYRVTYRDRTVRRRPVRGLAIQRSCEQDVANTIRERYHAYGDSILFPVAAADEIDNFCTRADVGDDAPIAYLGFLTRKHVDWLREYVVARLSSLPSPVKVDWNPSRLLTTARAVQALQFIDTRRMRLSWVRARARQLGLPDVPGLSTLDAGHERLGT